jgi:hypothetical protein
MSRRKPRKPLQVPRPLHFLREPAGAKPALVEGTRQRLTGQSARAERRISTFVAKNQIAQEQDWGARWISFQAIAQYCAKLRTPRKAVAGNAGLKFAYRELAQAVGRGEFNAGGRCRVLMLVSHGGGVFTITPNQLLEAQEAFDSETFETGYLQHCWTYAGLVSQWFRSMRIPPPWNSGKKPIIRVPRGRHFGAADHDKDVALVDLALEMRAAGKSDRTAAKAAISRARIADKSGSEVDRLRANLRKRRRLRQKNKAISS